MDDEAMNKLDKYMGAVASLGCIVCELAGYGEGTPAQLHHPRIEVGGAQRESDWLIIPLCPLHHTGREGVHTLSRSEFYRRFGYTELDLIAEVISRVYR